MKNLGYFFISIFFLFSFTSCQENGLFFPTSSQAKGSFQVTIDGQIFATENVNFTADNEVIFINAINPETNEVFTINVDDFELGNFSFEGENTVATYIQNNLVSADIWSTFNSTSSRGSVEFTNIDFVNNRVTGTFNFIGKNLTDGSSKAFTSGSFTNIPKSVLPISKNTFSAEVDGVEYIETSLFVNEVSIGTDNLILINANKSLSETIGFNLAADISVGEYDLNSFSSPSIQYTVDGQTYVGKGKINIIKHNIVNKEITAIFNCVASPVTGGTPEFTISEGEFNITY